MISRTAHGRFISLGIVLFFLFCLFEVYGFREDYPFSYFGMYKYGVHSSKFHSEIYVEVYVDGKIINNKKVFDPYKFKDRLRSLLIGEKISRNQIYLDGGERLKKESLKPHTQKKLDGLVEVEILKSKKMPKQYKTIAVHILYKEWESLSFETFDKPDQEFYVYQKKIGKNDG